MRESAQKHMFRNSNGSHLGKPTDFRLNDGGQVIYIADAQRIAYTVGDNGEIIRIKYQAAKRMPY